MHRIQKTALAYLVGLGLFAWGVSVGLYRVFPYSYILKVQEFAAGHDLEKETTVIEKLENDLGLKPKRHVYSYPQNATAGSRSLELSDLKERRQEPLVFIDQEHASGYRAIFGALDFEQSFWGGLLLDSRGEVIHTWRLSTEHLTTSRVHEELKNMYGLHLYPDGSVIFTHQEVGGGIVKVDACSNILWSLEGKFHHTISPQGEGHFWTFQGKQGDLDHKFALVSARTGKIESIIDMEEVRRANPFIHIFNLQKDPEISDISHGNDIKPLGRDLSSSFRRFETGDLLISYRTQNLLFVLDPESLQIKWWRVGAWAKQHDPDWQEDGTISVFSNNKRSTIVTSRQSSDIVKIDPETMEHEVIINGDDYDFYTVVNGLHARTPFDTWMITSNNQGWAFEVDDAGKIVFSFVNSYKNEENQSLNVAAADRYDANYFSREFWKQCAEQG